MAIWETLCAGRLLQATDTNYGILLGICSRLCAQNCPQTSFRYFYGSTRCEIFDAKIAQIVPVTIAGAIAIESIVMQLHSKMRESIVDTLK